ncbi:MAG: hypothetical protein U0232_22650 [Thermomicrobiales bacterium]
MDQRGVTCPRPAAGACDAGAVEVRRFSINRDGGNNQSAVINTAFTNPLGVARRFRQQRTGGGWVITFTGPGSGADIQGSPLTATIGSDGKASVSVTANGTIGLYSVTASGAGTNGSVNFNPHQSAHPDDACRQQCQRPLRRHDDPERDADRRRAAGRWSRAARLSSRSTGAVCGGGGQPACPTTDAGGVATLSDVSLGTTGAGSHPGYVGASFTTDATHAGSSDNARLNVGQAKTGVNNVSVSRPPASSTAPPV